MKNYVILTASAKTPYDYWYREAKQRIEEKGFEVCVPYLPQNEHQNYKAWARVILAYFKAGVINKETTIIAHDVACVFITRLLVENKLSVSGIIAVSPFNTILGMDNDNLNKSFITRYEKLQKVERFVKFYHVFTSDNDPIVSSEETTKFCESVNAKTHEVGNAGHFTEIEKFDELISLIDNINEII